MRTVVAMIVVVLVAAGAGGAYWKYVLEPQQQAANAPGGRGGPPPGFAMPVEAQPVKVAAAQSQVTAIGTLRSNEAVMIRPEVIGRVEQIFVKEGEKVGKGAVLIQLDAAVQRAELAQARANLELARANFERADELVKRGAGTQRALDEARAKLRIDEAAVALTQARLEKYAMVAPFDGVLGLRRISVGEFVNAGADVVNLESIDPIKVDFRVPEVFFTALKPGQPIAVTLDAVPGRAFAGEVFAIDPLIDQAGRSVVIRARIPNPDDLLRPGVFARVTLTIEERASALFVPEQSLVPIGDQHFVFKVVEAEGAKRVAFTRVTLGQRRKGEVEITGGLQAGDMVVSAGLLKIRDGMPVQIVPAGAPPAAPQGNGAPAVAQGGEKRG